VAELLGVSDGDIDDRSNVQHSSRRAKLFSDIVNLIPRGVRIEAECYIGLEDPFVDSFAKSSDEDEDEEN